MVIMRSDKNRKRPETFLQYICRAMGLEPTETLKIPEETLNFYGELYIPNARERKIAKHA